MAAEGPQNLPGTPGAGIRPPRSVFSSPVFRVQNGSFTSYNTPPVGSAVPRVSCVVATTPDPAKTPTRLRIDGGDLEQIEAVLAQFKACQPNAENMARLSESMGPDHQAHSQLMQSLKRIEAVLMRVDFGASGITSARVSYGGPSSYRAGLKNHPEIEIVLFVDGMLDPANLGPPLASLAAAVTPLCSGRYGRGWLGGDGAGSPPDSAASTPGAPPPPPSGPRPLAEVRKSRVRCRIDGIDLHIHLAPNLAEDGLSGSELIDGQREVALSLPAPSSQAERDVFRAALQETSHAFLVARGANAHAMIRLAMLWRAVNLLPRRVKAPAYLFELLGLMAYQLAARRTPGQQPPLNRCYQEFLNMVMAYKTLEIRWGAFYDVTTVSPGIAAQRPLVLDPGCPHNNVGNLLDKDAWRTVKRLAKACECAYQLGARTGAASLVDAVRAQDFF